MKSVLGLFAAAIAGTALWEALTAVLLGLSGYTTAPFADLWSRLLWANSTGIVMVAPLVLGLAAAVRNPPSWRETLEGTALLALHATATVHAFGLLFSDYGHWMLMVPLTAQLPFLLWLSLRCGPLFAAAGSLVLGLSMIGSIIIGRDRYAGTPFSLAERLLASQYAILAMSFVALVIAALISERKNAEQAARTSEERLRLSLDAGKLGTWEFEPGTGLFQASARARRCFGVPQGLPLPFSTVTGALYPADRLSFQALFQRAERDGSEFDGECRALWPDGSVHWLHIMGRATGNGSSGRGRVAGAVRDITEQKSISSLKESAEQLRLFVEQAPVAIAMFDPGMRYLAASKRWMTDFKLGQRGLIGRSHYEMFPNTPEPWKEAYRRAFAGEVISAEQDPVIGASGRTHWLRWEVSPWRLQDGSIGGVVIFVENVTARVETERALRETREDLNRAQAVARCGSWRLDVNRNELAWLDETYRIFGIPPGTPLTYENFLAAVHPGDRELVDRAWKAAVAGTPYDIEHRIVAGGQTKWVRQRAELDYTAAGRLLGGFGTVQDITDKKQAEEELVHLQRLTQLIGDRAADPIFLTDGMGRVTYANPEAERVFGYEPNEMIGQSLHDLVHHHYADGRAFPWEDCPMSKHQALGATIRNHEDVFFHKDGSPVAVSCSYAPLAEEGTQGGGVFVVRDISAAKAAQAALLESEERLRLSNEAAGIGTFTIDVGADRAQYSPELAAMLGFPGIRSASIEGAFARVHRDDLARVRAEYEAGLSGSGAGQIKMDFRFVRPGGEIRWMTWMGRVDFRQGAAGREPFRIAGACVDITDRKRAEEALREREERLRAIVGTAGDAIVVIDEAGRVQSINPSGERMFGYTASELTGKNVSVLMPEPHRAAHDGYVAAYSRTGEAKLGGGRELEHQRKDGSVFPADLAVAQWYVGGKRYYSGIIHDVTERKRHDEKVQLLLREVNHRAKNMLALVQAIASRTAAPDHGEFMKRFSERLSALAASQDLLVSSGWQGASIEALVRSQLSHFQSSIDNRITLAGPSLKLSAPAAQAIGMALHELATNAGKYGALASSTGGIEIEWRLGREAAGNERFALIWTEHGGPAVSPPKHSGFGTTVIVVMPRMELDAEVTLEYPLEGLRWRLECPAKRVLEIPNNGNDAAQAAE